MLTHASIHPCHTVPPTGFIKIAVLLTFNKLKAITTDPAVVARAVDEGGDATSGLIMVCETFAFVIRGLRFVSYHAM